MINTALLNYHKQKVQGAEYKNFVNASQCGPLEKMSKNIFGGVSWHKYFAVLSNVGLMCFQDLNGMPLEMFKFSDCQFAIVDPAEVNDCTTAFRLVYGSQ